MNRVLSVLGKWLARYLEKPHRAPTAATATPIEQLRACLQPADVLLVEGNTRFSTAIKYLTQSTWSHAALYVGGDERACFVEVDTVDGVRSVGLQNFADMHTRICRPFRLSAEERRQVIDYARKRISHQYDMRNIFDLARYLLPTPPVPSRYRRRMIALGSGDPSRAICSTLIAQAFQSIRYPILPEVEQLPTQDENIRELFHIRHHSLFTPRDFDVSPYFAVIKPTLESGFDFHRIEWHEASGKS
ncbi:YiiX/YebB-like N1pC/P60 family cysteine hydrolase [Microbulbifer halophilus]|uniref:YiiX/YebB-like N1pC/P60 family cysteine hydrolase n=1 Tax=Microbulbifer halophilus TaxID=453963 RepID=A0ABW5ECU0_9GAMM|nr:YiiX/YebB-like N1pC/P60 family cysteine hydrolase [Microbulbifer halophilus]MCW8125966.1 YiiX/YebB-like N1pC/P60 family cysteine hydrolase [Microbulbifer halophilus]